MIDILMVEDNSELATLIKTFLLREGFSVHHVSTGEEGIAYLKDHPVKILLLDVLLPGMDGFAVCRMVRQQGNMPVLIMSAKPDKSDKLIGYELGADDYMEKPVDADLLIARMKALLQRAYGAQGESELMISGGFTIDKLARKVYLNETLLELNVKEYELLMLFITNEGKTLHKEYLFNMIWGADSFSENQTLTVHIKMLRSKIEDNPKQPKRIQTVWGVGYRYEEV